MQSRALLELPSYLEHVPEVAHRVAALRERKVVLSVEGLTRVYAGGNGPVVALRDINFQVRKREFISVIGPSGCGKSTLARLLAGLDSPSTGVVRVDGIPVSGPGADSGMVFQGYTLFPWLTVKKNVMFGPSLNSSLELRSEKRALEWLRLVGLEDFADAYPSQLSGGMKQRVAIARALANSPRVLLMDEPFGALDAQTRGRMQAHLLNIWAEADVTILFITHDLDEAIYLSDRIVVLGARPGRVLEIVDVPVPRPRDPAQLMSPHFLATKRHLEKLIHSGAEDEPHSAPADNVERSAQQ
jgi:NitT/TauT family transport system ATP-binding protein